MSVKLCLELHDHCFPIDAFTAIALCSSNVDFDTKVFDPAIGSATQANVLVALF
jgi:hypothetical protein